MIQQLDIDTAFDFRRDTPPGKDPDSHSPTLRRYPYATADHSIEITVDINSPDIDRLTPQDIQLTFGPAAVHEEIKTWKEVYGIDERYKAKCCDADAKDWLEQIRIMRDARKIAPADSLKDIKAQAEIPPYANCNFLKVAFLEACEQSGCLSAL